MSPPSDRVETAYHEAGHAVIGLVHGITFERVTIVPDAESLGHVAPATPAEPATRAELDRLIDGNVCTTLAGPIAAAVYARRPLGKWYANGGAGDFGRARRLAATRCDGDAEEIGRYLRWLEARTHRLVSYRWGPIMAVAAALLQYGTLTGAACERVVRDAITGALSRREAR